MNTPRLLSSLAVCLSLFHGPASATEGSLVEFSPKDVEAMAWQVVNDGVMGGLSQGRITVSEQGVLNFSGKLSLQNNGGFSSIRSKDLKLDLSSAKGLVIRIKGDGRSYQLRLNSDARFRGREVSFMASFESKKGEWIEVQVPFDQFKGSFRGLKLKEAVLNTADIRRLGLLLGDKKEGDFELEVDWIRTFEAAKPASDKKPSSPPSAQPSTDLK